MKAPNYCIIYITCLLLLSCKGDNKEVNNNNTSTNSEVQANRLQGLKKVVAPENIKAMRAQALSILNHRLKNNPESYAIVEADVWNYEFVFDGEMSKVGEYEGVWIDFKPDFTYEYGKNSEVNGRGRYHYHFERSELLIIDNDASIKPKEWQIKSAGDVMILIGTNTYRDNSVQMKLVRVGDDFRK